MVKPFMEHGNFSKNTSVRTSAGAVAADTRPAIVIAVESVSASFAFRRPFATSVIIVGRAGYGEYCATIKSKSTTPNANTVSTDHPKRANAVCARICVSGAAKIFPIKKENEESSATRPKM